MHAELRRFIGDLVVILQDKYNQSLDDYESHQLVSNEDQFYRGANFGYYDALDLIRSQLVAFGYETDDMEPIVHELGRRI